MNPIVILDAAHRYMDDHGIPRPVVLLERGVRLALINLRGVYASRDGVVKIWVDHCKPGVPGGVEDTTLQGVVWHEFGHHVHWSRGLVKLRVAMHDLWHKEAPISRYGSLDKVEDFAEAFRLFVLNPTLLKEARPRRYAFLLDTVGLRPVELRHWREVLAESPQRVQEAEKVIYG